MYLIKVEWRICRLDILG